MFSYGMIQCGKSSGNNFGDIVAYGSIRAWLSYCIGTAWGARGGKNGKEKMSSAARHFHGLIDKNGRIDSSPKKPSNIWTNERMHIVGFLMPSFWVLFGRIVHPSSFASLGAMETLSG
eukprot:6486194-Amphidinium_carterae.2